LWDKRLLQFPIYLSVFTEIHQSLEYEENESQSFNDLESTFTQKKLDSSVNSLSEAPMDKYSKKGIPFYLLKAADILPSDIDEEKMKEFNRKFRPEFFLNYKSTLNPDVFLISDDIDEKMSQDNTEAMQASFYLQNDHLVQFLKQIEEKDYFPLESYSLRELFHSQGVNMRYLGKIAKYTVIPHIKQICLTDMVARKIKTIFRYYLADFIKYPENYDKRKRSLF